VGHVRAREHFGGSQIIVDYGQWAKYMYFVVCSRSFVSHIEAARSTTHALIEKEKREP
jgi:hypothetical protein